MFQATTVPDALESAVSKTENLNLSQEEDTELLRDSVQPLRALTSLKWPYVPEEPAYPDPLKRDDPKPLQLTQYEAIGTLHSTRFQLFCR